MTKEIKNLIAELEKVQQVIPELAGAIIQDNSHVLEDLQTDQLNQGITSEGNQIKPSYSPFTVQIKKAKGQPFDRVTLKDTGDFHRNMFLAGGQKNTLFQIGNRDEKAKKIEGKYGPEIFGLTEQSLNVVVNDLLRPEMLQKLRAYMNLN